MRTTGAFACHARSARIGALVGMAALVTLLIAALMPAIAQAAAAPGTIQGTVTGGGGPLSRVAIDVWKYSMTRDEWDWHDSTSTEGSGAYSLELEAGRYRLEARPRGRAGWIGEFYNNAADLEHATDVVVDGAAFTANFALARTGGISGTVSLPEGEDRDRPVRVYDESGKLAGRTNRVGADGTWSVWGLATGSYRVAFNRVSGPSIAAAQYYDRKSEAAGLAGADAVTVTRGALTQGVDAVLPPGGQIAGTLVDPAGSPLPSCRIQAYTTDGSRVTRVGESDAEGRFAVTGLSTGSYLLRVLGNAGECDGGAQFYDGAADGVLARDPEGARPISVTLRDTTTLVRHLVYTRSGRISGHVTLPVDAENRDRRVVVRDVDTGDVAAQGRATRSGDYSISGLAGGTYRVTFARLSGTAIAAAQFYNGKPEHAGSARADHVSVGFGEHLGGIDARLVEGGHITGRLVGRDRVPLADCYVQAYTADRSLVTRTAWTAEDGTFDIGGLTTGQYQLRVVGNRWSGCDGGLQFYDGDPGLSPDEGTARGIGVTLRETTGVSTLIYTAGGRITGTVTLPAGASAKDERLRIIDTANGRIAAEVRNLPDDGTFSVGGLAPGSYQVAFNRVSGVAFSAAQFYDGKTEDQGSQSADTIDVGLGVTVAGIDASLVEGGHIVGRLTDGAGNPIHCYVQAYTDDRSLVTRAAWSDVDTGAYDIGGLSSGSYSVRVVPGGDCAAGVQYRQIGTDLLSGSSADADAVPITLGGSFRLPPLKYRAGSRISGTVTLGDGMGAADFNIAVVDTKSGRRVARYDAAHRTSHTYSIGGLAPGSYRVEFAREPGQRVAAAQFYDGVDEPDAASATTIVLKAGEALEGVDATLKVGGVLQGTLLDGLGNPLSCAVEAFTADGRLVTRSGHTGPDGSFALTGLSTGKYLLSAEKGDCGPDPRYAVGSGGKMTADGAHAVPVDTVVGDTVTLDEDLVFADPVIVNDAVPTIEGAPFVGGTLTARPGEWRPADATYAYQWLAAGAPIDGATDATYSPVASDVGKTLKVTVTATRPGFVDGVATSATTAAVAPEPVVNQSPPTITGEPDVGETLTGSPGSWTPSDVTFAYEWRLSGRTAVAGTDETFIVPADAVGRTVTLTVVGSRPGTGPASATSEPTAEVGVGHFTLERRPTVTGKPRVGKTLTAWAGSVTPAAAAVKYQWLRNGKAVKRAVKRKYELTRKDKGARISVKVVYTSPSYARLKVSSARTRRIRG